MSKLNYPLFVFDLANNHMGSAAHGLKVIRAVHEVCRDFDFRFGFKLQYRHLDTFIHPDFKNRMDIKYVKRFSETRLSEPELKSLKDEISACGFLSICTPFDEASVDLIEAHGFDVIKVASCSFTDWPLLERIASSDKPILASTAGVPLEDIDKVVSFLDHRGKEFAILHCVAEYPTPDARLNLNQIDLLKGRYPQVPIGYSTHERPEQTGAVQLAIAKGAAILEKHVGVPTAEWPLNNYSLSPEHLRRWLEAAKQAFEWNGVSGSRAEFAKDEIASLKSLRRGAFARRAIAKGERIDSADLFFAIPSGADQIQANDISKYAEIRATADIKANAALDASNATRKDLREKIYGIVKRIGELIRKSGVVIPSKVDLEISHHYGVDRFDEFGLAMITIVNRAYCKKLIVLLPGQSHPEQYHKQKEETFHVLHGDMWVKLDGNESRCAPGDIVVVERGAKHAFGTEAGVILEEISSTHFKDDSFYTDPAVADNKHRKTILTYWMNA